MMEVRRLLPTDNRTQFCSGNLDLDSWFYRYAGQNQFQRYISVSYVMFDGGRIIGYASVAASAVRGSDLTQLDHRWPAFPLPALRLARLATDQHHRGRGVAALLLRQVFEIALLMRETLGCVGIVVDAKRDAIDFYHKFDFEAVQAATSSPQEIMFIEIKNVAKALTRPSLRSK